MLPLIFSTFLMKFTFGIITFDDQEERVSHIIEDIKEYSDDSEIIVVGGSHQYGPDIKHVRFDESVNSGWITRKKNIVTELASNQNIVYAHDYYTINPTEQLFAQLSGFLFFLQHTEKRKGF